MDHNTREVGTASGMRPMVWILLALLSTGWVACSDSSAPSGLSETRVQRWYTPDQVARGQVLFQQHCAECHKADASGSPNWKEADAQGQFPPPPLNGTAHAWHHPLELLRRVVRLGGIPAGGSMPAFKDKLSATEIDDILAWVQSHWPDKIYRTWQKIDQSQNKS